MITFYNVMLHFLYLVPILQANSLQRTYGSSQQHLSSLVITTTTRSSPPTEITWYRNNEAIDFTHDNASVSTYITNRESAFYTIALTLKNEPENMVGNYSARIGNARGAVTMSLSSEITGKNCMFLVLGFTLQCILMLLHIIMSI